MKSATCACGVVIEGRTGAGLLAAVERHVAVQHPQLRASIALGLGLLDRRVAEVERRLVELERG